MGEPVKRMTSRAPARSFSDRCGRAASFSGQNGAVTTTIDASKIAAELTRAGVRDVLADTTNRAAYSTDASLYRVVPRAIVRPHDTDEVLRVLEVARRLQVPITPRGAGTSCAGNAVGPGIVLDFTKHLNKVLDVDIDARTARVQTGTVHQTLQRLVMPQGVRFGPDPSSHTRCTIGGMIGNNACGSRALAYGKTSDNVLGLTMATAAGELLELTHGTPRADLVASSPQLKLLDELVGDNLGTIRTEFGRFGRQVSGYAMENLLPENGFDVARFMAGTEGTLGVLTEATVRLVTDPKHRVLVALGYTDMASAGDAAPLVRAFDPIACEGMDKRLVDVLVARRGAQAVPPLPKGEGWLLVEIAGDDLDEVITRAQACRAGSNALDGSVVTDQAVASRLWKVREDGAGLAGRSPKDLPAWPGWEDAAVPPEQLGAYLREFDALLDEYQLSGMPYGHFGDGCMHIRIDFPLRAANGQQILHDFLGESAKLVAKYGGSMSGEHGDGRARSEFLASMYSPEALQLFAGVKEIFDPSNLLNPGVLVDPDAAAANVRMTHVPKLTKDLALAYIHDGGDFAQAVHRCTGVGKCRASTQGTTNVMCPSYAATGNEKDSTRGRARLLQEMVQGGLGGAFISEGWKSKEVHEALDLCLSCKGCTSDCPTGIDMPAFKSEVLHQTYKNRIRPRSHYALGQLPRWVRLGAKAPALFNLALKSTEKVPALKKIAGVDPRRSVPSLATQTFRAWCADNNVGFFEEGRTYPENAVVIMVDTFTDHFSPEVGQAAVRVLRRAGWEPLIIERAGCCGLTWISTGQLDGAKKQLRGLVGDLAPVAAQHIPVVGLEPSCTAVLRGDSAELLPSDPEAALVAKGTSTLAEFLAGDDKWQAPNLHGTDVVAQPHCHHHGVMGWSTDAQLLKDAGASVKQLGGCCGLAGNFGVEQGHYEVSVAVAEQHLFPAMREHPDSDVLADGFSCRTQIADLTERRGIHLAQLLDRAQGGEQSVVDAAEQ